MKQYYFFEPDFVTKAEGAALTFGSVQKVVTNARWVDAYSREEQSDIPDWEHQVSIMYPYVLYDENGVSVDTDSPAPYKMWYFSKAVKNPVTPYNWLNYVIDQDNSRGVELLDFKNTAKGTLRTPDSVLCYMESTDGITWRRPNCGEFYYKQQDGTIVGTNIVFIGEHGMGVHKNTHPQAGKTEPAFLFGCGGKGVGFSWSENGIHWHSPVSLILEQSEGFRMPGDTHNQLFWSEELSKYVLITRGFDGDVRLVVALTTVEGMHSIPKIVATQEGVSGEEARLKARACFSKTNTVLTGSLAHQPYSLPLARLKEGAYIGAVSMSNFEENTNGFQHVYASLAVSKNGETWQYLCEGAPFIANAETFALEAGNDHGMIYCAPPVRVGSESKIFYAAVPELHYFSHDQIPPYIRETVDERIPKAKAASAITRTAALNVATFPRDCFAGYGGTEGTVVTKAISVSGAATTLGVAVEKDGYVTAALIDENGVPLKGFTHTDCVPITQTGADQPLAWNTSAKTFADQPLSLEIRLHRATVFTLKI